MPPTGYASSAARVASVASVAVSTPVIASGVTTNSCAAFCSKVMPSMISLARTVRGSSPGADSVWPSPSAEPRSELASLMVFAKGLPCDPIDSEGAAEQPAQSAMASRQAIAPASATRRCGRAEWERWRECGDVFMVSPRAAWGVCGAFARDRWFDCRNSSVYRRAGGRAKHGCRFKERLIVGSRVFETPAHSSTPRSSAVGRITLSLGTSARRSSSFHGCSLPAPASTASESLKFWMNQGGHNGAIADRASSAIQ